MKKSTIYEIAECTGVSASTVSRVLNNNPRISKITRAKVIKAAQKLNYTLAPIEKRPGNRLKKNNTKRNIVFYTESWLSQDLLEGIQTEAARAGCEMKVVSNSDGKSGLSLITNDEQQPDGIIFLGTPEELIKSQILSKIPGVQIFGHTDVPGIEYDRVTYNQKGVASIAADYLARAGVSNVAMYYQNGYIAAEERMALFRIQAMMRKLDITDLGTTELRDVYTPVPTQRVKDYIASANAPCGFFCFNDSQGMQLMMQLMSLGLELKKDYYLISCDNTQNSYEFFENKPATIDIDRRLIGSTAVKQLMQKLQNPDEPVNTVNIDPKLISG